MATQRTRRIARVGALLLLVVASVFPTMSAQSRNATPASSAPATLPLEAVWLPFERYSTTSVVTGDINGDGLEDLLFSANEGSIHLYLNQAGMPSFRHDWESSLPGKVRDLALADMNGDGWLDLVAASYNGPLAVYRNQGGALPTTPTWQTPPEQPLKSFSIAVGDLDGDSDHDVLIASYGAKALLYRNRGDGTFPAHAWESLIALNAVYVTLGDYDHDQDLDAAFALYGSTRPPRLYTNVGGTLSSAPSWEADVSDVVNSTTVAMRDLDGDNYLELVVGNEGDPIRIYDNVSGTLSTTATWETSISPLTQDLVLGDIDGDDDDDLIATTGIAPVGSFGGTRGPLQVYLNHGGLHSTTPDWESQEHDLAYSLAVVDIENDGDLDIVRANDSDPNRLYLNHQAPIDDVAFWRTPSHDSVRSIDLGDANGDGMSDVAIGTQQGVQVYLSSPDGTLSTLWQPTTTHSVYQVAWADMDMDTDLDLVVGAQGGFHIYVNNGEGDLGTGTDWDGVEYGSSYASFAIGDADNDGDLDLVITSLLQPVTILANLIANPDVNPSPGSIWMHAAWAAPLREMTRGAAWGDFDQDGDLDVAVANDGQPGHIYRNDGVTSAPSEYPSYAFSSVWTNSNFFDSSRGVSWADVNSDGRVDLAFANYGQPNRIYLNSGQGTLALTPAWSSHENDPSNGIRWCDIEGDGDLDQLVFNESAPTRLYRNQDGVFEKAATWSSGDVGRASAGACGDVDRDGDVDIGVAYLNPAGEGDQPPPLPPPPLPSAIYLNRRFDVQHAGEIPQIELTAPGVPTANLFTTSVIADDPTLAFSYTLRGTGAERVQVEFSRTGGGQWEPALADSAAQQPLTPTMPLSYGWDVFRSGFMGGSDSVALRMTAYPNRRPGPHQVAGSYRYGAASVTSPLLRVRGTGIRVFHEGRPAAHGRIMRLAAGELAGGTWLTSLATDSQGYLQGNSVVRPGDRLLALLPISTTANSTLYATNGVPTPLGLESFEVEQPGTQQIDVSLAHPLILFDLIVSLEWNASRDHGYIQQLNADLKRASRHLYDMTDGQVALGTIQVYQRGEHSDDADIVIHATNQLRPHATIGGIVQEATPDPEHPSITYRPGQVHIGVMADRSGRPDAPNREDWPLILAHELGHYLLFEEDTYLGLNEAGILVPTLTCEGSAMGDIFGPENRELLFERLGETGWLTKCAQTLAHQTLGRTEWETLQLWYPALHAPSATMRGPALMPFDLTSVTVLDPPAAPAPLEDTLFTVHYAPGGVRSRTVQAYLLRAPDAPHGGQVLALGTLPSDINQIDARGAAAGDRLCVFDGPQRQVGCETLTAGDQTLSLTHHPDWSPQILFTPITSRTLDVRVEGLPTDLDLRARLFPLAGEGNPVQALAEEGPAYTTRVALEPGEGVGYIQLWVEEPDAEGAARRETIVSYTIGGSPIYIRGSISPQRGGEAPLLSPDGVLLVYTDGELSDDQLVAIQPLAGLSSLPTGLTPVGQAYRVAFSPSAATLTASVALQYRQYDVNSLHVDETNLRLLFMGEAGWEVLSTTLDPTTNIASARSNGSGLYILAAGQASLALVDIAPQRLTNDQPFTITVAGGTFLPPLTAVLTPSDGLGSTIPLTVVSGTATSLVLQGPEGVRPNAYALAIRNGDEGQALSSQTIDVVAPEQACFAERFESSLTLWTVGGGWARVLPENATAGYVLTDSPRTPYPLAPPPLQVISATITSPEIDLTGCEVNAVRLRHAYGFASLPGSQDWGHIELWDNVSQQWMRIASYTGHSDDKLRSRLPTSDSEWLGAQWRTETISLGHHQGQRIRLRFVVESDQRYADRGWAIDDLELVLKDQSPVFLPLTP